MTVSLDDAKTAKAEARQGNLRENDAGIPEDQQIDYSEHSPVELKGHAESLITFDHIARISVNDYGALDGDESLLNLEQNLENAGRYGFDVTLTLADPELVDGQLWMEADGGEYPEYKIIGDPESDDNDYELRESIIKDEDGNPVDTEIDGIGGLGTSSWDGQPVEDGFDGIEYVELSINSRRASRILGALDTAGQWARTQDGELTEGLFEAPPNFGTEEYDPEEDGAPRMIGYPELRADMVGQRGAVAFTFGDANSSGNRAKEVDIFKVTDDGLEALVPVTPDDDAYALPTYPRKNNFYWDDSSAPQGADAEPETTTSVEDAQAAMSDDPTDRHNDESSATTRRSEGDDTDGVTYDDLTDDEVSFVEDAAQGMAKQGYESVDAFAEQTAKSFEERAATYDGNMTHDVDELATVVENLRGV